MIYQTSGVFFNHVPWEIDMNPKCVTKALHEIAKNKKDIKVAVNLPNVLW